MEVDRGSERYIADYGILLLEVSLRSADQKSVFGYVVTDKTDGFTCWIGSASDLVTAQSDAILEAQIFLDPYRGAPPAPQWRHDAGLGAQV
jgi:hypothetical protein